MAEWWNLLFYNMVVLPLNSVFVATFLLASGPGTPDSIEGVSQHLSPESSRKAYCRTWEQPSQSASFTHMPQSPNVFNEHVTNSTMSPGTAAQSLKSPASIRSRSVSDSSVPRRGNTALFVSVALSCPQDKNCNLWLPDFCPNCGEIHSCRFLWKMVDGPGWYSKPNKPL